MKRKQIKALIELSSSFEEANDIIEKYTDLRSYGQKIAYLQGMFDCEIVGHDTKDVEVDYVAILTSIVEHKWTVQGRNDTTTQISLSIEDDVKKKAEEVCEDLGLSLSTAVNIYLKKLVREKRIPFDITLDNDD